MGGGGMHRGGGMRGGFHGGMRGGSRGGWHGGWVGGWRGGGGGGGGYIAPTHTPQTTTSYKCPPCPKTETFFNQVVPADTNVFPGPTPNVSINLVTNEVQLPGGTTLVISGYGSKGESGIITIDKKDGGTIQTIFVPTKIVNEPNSVFGTTLPDGTRLYFSFGEPKNPFLIPGTWKPSNYDPDDPLSRPFSLYDTSSPSQ